MSDLISRTGAIAHFDKVAEELDEQRGDDSWVGNAFKICLLGVVNDLAVLPSADRPTGWIPASERLPEDGVDVLITTENEEVYIDQVITDPFKERYFQSNTGYDNFQVIAWMPLPEPYKGGEDE